MTISALELTGLRKSLRKQRRQISHFQQRQSEFLVLNRLIRHPKFQHAKHIGLYLHAFGEIQTSKIIERCFALGKTVYLPMICNMNQQLKWVTISQHQYHNKRFAHHHLGMKEPMHNRGQHVSRLDLLLVPLLACDPNGTRIGMGGGFYDRTLASAPHRPYRLGIAHEFQFINEPLFKNVWDQPLDCLITPQKIRHFKRSKK